jgi:virginiamycin B lyase
VLWFTEGGGKIGRITTAGYITEYPVLTSRGEPAGIALGPDGALWFTEDYGNNIGRIAPASGTFTEYPIPTAGSNPLGITVGPDGKLWFTENATNKIGNVTTCGAFTEYSIPTKNSHPIS